MRIRLPILISILFIFTTTALYADSLINCKTGNSASVGDLKQEVRLSCGEPERTEIIGYIDKMQDQERIRVMKIEEWIYLIPHFGKQNYYSLVFEGNRLKKIESAGDNK